MLCVNPFRTEGEEFGCGKCLPCRFKRRRTWVGRMQLESLLHRHSCFVTLTYKEAPDGFRKEDVQSYVRALRKRGVRLRYFGVGERGSRGGRVHWHVAMFGVSAAQQDVLRKCWHHGFVDIGEFNGKVAHYIAKYICKGGDCARISSLKPGIGADFAPRMAALLPGSIEDVPPGIRVSGRIVPVSRYVRNRVRQAMGRSEGTPSSVREKQKGEYLAGDSALRERQRENGYLSAVVRLDIMKSKEKL